MLAEITIPSTSSPRAVFCLVGIVYFIVCGIICSRGMQGWLTCLVLFIVGLVILGIFTPSKGEFGSTGIPSFTEQHKDSRGNYVNHDYVYEREEKTTYYMHNPQNPNRVNPWFFHPGCLWQAPLIICLLGLFAFFTGAHR